MKRLNCSNRICGAILIHALTSYSPPPPSLFLFCPNTGSVILFALLLSLSTSLPMPSISSSLHLFHLSSTLFLLLSFLLYASLKYEFIDEFHDDLWHLGAETRLMRGNYQDAELTNGLLPSFVSSWSRREGSENGSTKRVTRKWTFECVLQVRMSCVFFKTHRKKQRVELQLNRILDNSANDIHCPFRKPSQTGKGKNNTAERSQGITLLVAITVSSNSLKCMAQGGDVVNLAEVNMASEQQLETAITVWITFEITGL